MVSDGLQMDITKQHDNYSTKDSKMTKKVHFIMYFVIDNDVQEFDEAYISLHIKEVKQLLELQPNFDGAIVIEMEDGSSLRIDDELMASIQNFCYNSSAQLANKANGSYTYSYFSSFGKIEMILSNNTINIHGDYIPTITCDKAELLKQLVQCGNRFMDLLGVLGYYSQRQYIMSRFPHLSGLSI